MRRLKRNQHAVLPTALVVGGVLAAAALAAGGVLTARALSSGSGSGDGSAGGGHPTAEAAVRDLTRTQTLSGVIAHRDLRELVPAQTGTLTWLPAVGDDLTSGEVLMRVDDEPVVLLTGTVPAWRDMDAGVADGPDVAQLEGALLALGHGVQSATFPDGHWDKRTFDAVVALQTAVGAAVDGSLSLGEVIFTAGDVHVAKLDVPLGGPAVPDVPVMTVQSTERVVLLDLNPLDSDLVAQGDPVEVELPSGDTASGSVESVSTTLELDADNQSVFKVKVALADPSAGAELDLAPVTVRYPTTVATAVLSVPVTAVVGVLGGGHAVDVVADDGSVRRVLVVLGAWGDGFVQVAGDLEPGDRVEVPA